MTRYVIKVRRRIAAPAPQYGQKDAIDREARRSLPGEIDAMAHSWAQWCRTRRYFGPPDRLPSIIGQLRTRTPQATDGNIGPNAACSQELAIFNLAVQYGGSGKDRMVFEMHYRYRPASIRVAAAALGISRQHWYTLRNSYARKTWAAQAEIARQLALQTTLFARKSPILGNVGNVPR